MPRPPGVPNKSKQALLNLLQEKYPGYHPIMEMAGIANDMEAPLAIRANMHKEIAQYVVAKRKAIEISTDPDKPLQVSLVTFGQVIEHES